MNFPKQVKSNSPIHRYQPFTPIDLSDRTWPSKTITVAPIAAERVRTNRRTMFELHRRTFGNDFVRGWQQHADCSNRRRWR